MNLLEEIRARIAPHDHDVALIAAGGLGALLAVDAKDAGRVGISLGGHLQVVFGVVGERWLEDEGWRRDYINESWVRVPARYAPLGRNGANYW